MRFCNSYRAGWDTFNRVQVCRYENLCCVVQIYESGLYQ